MQNSINKSSKQANKDEQYGSSHSSSSLVTVFVSSFKHLVSALQLQKNSAWQFWLVTTASYSSARLITFTVALDQFQYAFWGQCNSIWYSCWKQCFRRFISDNHNLLHLGEVHQMMLKLSKCTSASELSLRSWQMLRLKVAVFESLELRRHLFQILCPTFYT